MQAGPGHLTRLKDPGVPSSLGWPDSRVGLVVVEESQYSPEADSRGELVVIGALEGQMICEGVSTSSDGVQNSSEGVLVQNVTRREEVGMKWEFLLSTMKSLMEKPRPVCEHRPRQEWSWVYSSRCTSLGGSQTGVLQEGRALNFWVGVVGRYVFYLQWGEPVVERDFTRYYACGTSSNTVVSVSGPVGLEGAEWRSGLPFSFVIFPVYT